MTEPTGTEVERRLRDELTRRAEVPPPGPGLADRAITGATRTRRRRRWGAVTAAAVAVVAVVAATGFPRQTAAEVPPAAPVTGPPRIPLLSGGEDTQLLRWRASGEPETSTLAAGIQVVGQVPAGLLLVVRGERPALGLLRDGDPGPTILLRDLATAGGVAVSAEGRRATVALQVPDTGDQVAGMTLREIELPSGRTLRQVPVGPPLAEAGEPVLPVAYAGGSVLLTVGEGDRQRAYLWEAGDGQVVGRLTGYRNARDGTGAGLGAFDVTGDDRCRVEIAALRTGGRHWRLCREPFAGFSPGGTYVLATTAVGDGLVVRRARDGGLLRRFGTQGYARAYGWESPDTVLFTTLARGGRSTLVVRCSVASGRCATAATFPTTERTPGPVPTYGTPAR